MQYTTSLVTKSALFEKHLVKRTNW